MHVQIQKRDQWLNIFILPYFIIYIHNKEYMNTNYFDVIYDKCMKMRSYI